MSPPAAVPLPSWRWPIALGALGTALVHLPLLREHLLWVALPASFGITGTVCALLPTWFAVRRETEPRLATGFAAGFTAVGAGIVALALLTVWQGFAISAEQAEFWRAEFLRAEQPAELVDEFFARLRGGEGGQWVALTAAFVAFGGGVGGALVAAFRTRRWRARALRAGAPAAPGPQAPPHQ